MGYQGRLEERRKVKSKKLSDNIYREYRESLGKSDFTQNGSSLFLINFSCCVWKSLQLGAPDGYTLWLY